MLEAIEQRAAGSTSRSMPGYSAGRTYRHASVQLIDHESFDRVVACRGTTNGDSFSAEDIAWLLEHAPGEIVIKLRPQLAPSAAEGGGESDLSSPRPATRQN